MFFVSPQGALLRRPVAGALAAAGSWPLTSTLDAAPARDYSWGSGEPIRPATGLPKVRSV